MSFRKLSDCARDLKTVVNAVKVDGQALFGSVRIAAVTSYDNLLQLLPSLGKLPAAVVCIGTGQFDDTLTERTFKPAIIVIDKLHAVEDDKAAGIWDILEEVTNAFITNADKPPADPLTISGVHYSPGNFVPVALSASVSAYMLELNAIN